MRILGLDIGTNSVKAVEIESAFRRFEIHEYHEQKFAKGTDPLEAARLLIESLPRKPDRIAVSLAASQSTFRNLQLPTRDRKAIQASVGFELEDDLPFDLAHAVYDYTVLSQSAQGSQLHVAATMQKHVERALEAWTSGNIDPDVIVPESWAYRTYLNRILGPTEREEPVILIQIGVLKTVIYIHWHGTPIVSRELAWGGQDITASIAARYGVAEEQAEIAKLDHGFILTDEQRTTATADQLEFSEAIVAGMQPLLQELRQAEFICRNTIRHGISRVYLCGGGSLLPGLARRLEEDLRIPAQNLLSLSTISTSGITYSETADAHFLLAASLALCQVGDARSTGISFRKGKYSKSGRSRELNIAALKKPLLMAAAVVACLGASLTVRSMTYQRELALVDEQLERQVRGLFGSLSQSSARQYLRDTPALKKKVNDELKKQRDQSKLAGPNAKSPIAFLRELSSGISKDPAIDLMKFQVGAAPTASFSTIDDSSVSLVFYLKNAQSADRLMEQIGRKVKDPKKTGPLEVTLPDGTKRFKVEFTGKPLEDAYGK